jgi:hypothetical protein
MVNHSLSQYDILMTRERHLYFDTKQVRDFYQPRYVNRIITHRSSFLSLYVCVFIKSTKFIGSFELPFE